MSPHLKDTEGAADRRSVTSQPAGGSKPAAKSQKRRPTCLKKVCVDNAEADGLCDREIRHQTPPSHEKSPRASGMQPQRTASSPALRLLLQT